MFTFLKPTTADSVANAAFNTSSVAMMSLGADGAITKVNPAATKLFREHEKVFSENWPGFRIDACTGQTPDLFAKDMARQAGLLRNATALPAMVDVSVGDRKFSVTIAGLFDGSGRHHGNILEWADVTGARTTTSILEAIDQSQAMIEFTLDGKIVMANENFLQTVGYDLSEIVGRHHRIFVEPEYARSKEYADFWAMLRSGECVTDKFKRVSKAGETIWLNATYNSVVDGSGKAFKVTKIATDITHEETLRRTQTEALEAQTEMQASVVRELGNGLRAMSNGDLTVEIEVDFDERYQELKDNFNSTVGRLDDTIGRAACTSQRLKGMSVDMQRSAEELSKRTENQAATLEQTAAALDEITATVKQTAITSEQARGKVGEARENAEKSGHVVKQTVEAMSHIQESSEKITQIISVIDEIAFQTNLLALNAGVEAARAGDAGRGFAVVASEVRALAQRSSDAAKDIKELISSSVTHVQSGVDLVDQTGKALDMIVSEFASVDVLVRDISESAQEQATAIGEINNSINQMDRVTQKNAAMVEETTTACHVLTQEASTMSDLLAHFKTVSGEVQEPAAAATPRNSDPSGVVSIVERAHARPSDDAPFKAPAQTPPAPARTADRGSVWADF